MLLGGETSKSDDCRHIVVQLKSRVGAFRPLTAFPSLREAQSFPQRPPHRRLVLRTCRESKQTETLAELVMFVLRAIVRGYMG